MALHPDLPTSPYEPLMPGYLGDVPDPSLDDDDLRDYFLAQFGPKPVGKTTDSNTPADRLTAGGKP